MGIELYPKFVSLTETRCYPPLCESIVAKCCQALVLNLSDGLVRLLGRWSYENTPRPLTAIPALAYARRMSNEEDKSWYRYRDAMSASTESMRSRENEQALRLLDGAIAIAIGENENRWVLTLSHHAAIIASVLGDWPRVKHYYEQSLAFNPENPAALSGLSRRCKRARQV
jgi:hypothetical protein